jgi:type VI secretion system protein ImpA
MEEDFGGSIVDRLLQPQESAAGPCGPDMENDIEFFELERAAQGKPETQFSEAIPPNSKDVQNRAEALLERSRDLRAAVLWARAGVSLHGFDALPEGLRLIHGLLEVFWDHLHPLPDPDDNDPYARMNALASLGDAAGLLGDLRRSALFNVRGIGELRIRDVELSLRLLPPRAGESAPAREHLMQMLRDAVAVQPALRDRSRTALARLRDINSVLAQKASATTQTPDLQPLQRLLEGIESLMPADSTPEVVADAVREVPAGPESLERSGTGVLAGGVHSRQDALRAIDMVCEFLERTEPTNPAPLFLRRARRLISHSFLQLVKELAPGALEEVARVMGVNPETVLLEDPG